MVNNKNYLNKIQRVLPKVNITYFICDHLVGIKHKPQHRIASGLFIIIIGTVLISIQSPVLLINYSSHIIGPLFHGLGATPFVEEILQFSKNNLNMYILFRFHGMGDVNSLHPIITRYNSKEELDSAIKYNKKVRGKHALFSKEEIISYGVLSEDQCNLLLRKIKRGDYNSTIPKNVTELTKLTHA